MKSVVGCLTSHDVLTKMELKEVMTVSEKASTNIQRMLKAFTITTEKGVGNKELDILSVSMSKSLDIVPAQSISKLALGFLALEFLDSI